MTRVAKVSAVADRRTAPEARDYGEAELSAEAIEAIQKRADEVLGDEDWKPIDEHGGN